MNKKSDCKRISLLLGDYVRESIDDEKIGLIEKHLKTCSSCRATKNALAIVARAARSTHSDLWPSFKSRLEASEKGDQISLVLPPLTWRAALALAVVLVSLAVVSNPLRLLITLGIL